MRLNLKGFLMYFCRGQRHIRAINPLELTRTQPTGRVGEGGAWGGWVRVAQL
jgi:hypothetical protein